MIRTVYYHEGRVVGRGTRANTHNSHFGPFTTRVEAEQHLAERQQAYKEDSWGVRWRGFIREKIEDDS